MSEQEVIRTFTTLGAVVLGFLLSQVSELIKSKKKTDQRKQSIRRLIELETKNNVSYIKEFWQNIISSKEEWNNKDGEFQYVQLANQASRIPFPQLTTDAWRFNLGEVAAVYSQTELEKLWKLQRNIDRLFSLHVFFCEACEEREESSRFYHAMHGSSVGTLMSHFRFSDSVRNLAKEFKSLVETIIGFNESSA